MTDIMNNLTEEHKKEENFADLFESYSKGMNDDVRIGDKIKGQIISIGKDCVFVDTGIKIDGVVDIDELLDENQEEFPYKEGDFLELYVVAYNGSEIRLSKAMSGDGGINVIMDAHENSVPVEGKVKAECKGGFNVDIMQKRAFCPISQMDTRYVEDPKQYVGNTYLFLITELEEDGRNIIVSRRQLLENEQKKARDQFFQEIKTGEEFDGRIIKLMPFGAFIELIPGIEGMVHISEMSWSRVEQPEELMQTGDTVRVKVIKIEDDTDSGKRKIALSMKQIEANPWDSVQEKFSIGDKLRGKVTRCMKFGAFVEIAPGIEGLVHISEMSHKRVVHAEDVAEPGSTVDVMVKEINLQDRRISLSMRDAEGDPWIDIEKKYSLGQSVEGMIEKKEKFGFFIELE
ncbi:MAG: S1 RNA-binding domain-containing protein, partial [Deltaproteobacteria bacterium]|nr:S1 RNA-binding domain-containing protein [Deltaproteobacteria bacterium]